MPISFYIYKAQLRKKSARLRQGHTALGRAVSRRYMYEIGVYTIFMAGGLLLFPFPPKKVGSSTHHENTYFVLLPPNVSRLITVSNGSSFISLIWSRMFFISSEAVMNLPFWPSISYWTT